MNKAQLCPLCGIALHWENISGIRLYRHLNGRKVYRTRCPKCFHVYEIPDGVQKPKKTV